jgi:GMP synthase (glutamine-hydrolysing)
LTLLVVDNLSPFVPDILDCLDRLGIMYVYKKFSDITDSDLTMCDRVILSGRRMSNKEINAVNSRIVRQCYDKVKPLLGICYGAEIIALTLGGSIRKMPNHVQGLTAVSMSDQNVLTEGKKTISVYESHGYCIARLPPNFKSLGSSKSCAYEIFASRKIYGTQFHPEKSGSDGLALLHNFLSKT